VVAVSRQVSELYFEFRAAVSPDAPDQRPLCGRPSKKRLLTTVGQLEASRTFANPADERSPCTDPPWRIEQHDNILVLGRQQQLLDSWRDTADPETGGFTKVADPAEGAPSSVPAEGLYTETPSTQYVLTLLMKPVF
jgi:hypothetical protein